MMNKSALAAQGAVSIALMGVLVSLSQADSVRYSDIEQLELDMETATVVASDAISGRVIEAELEKDDDKTIWEVDILSNSKQLVTVEIDGQSGQLLSMKTDNQDEPALVDTLSLSKAIEIVKAVEQGTIVEMELEIEGGNLVWEVESLSADNKETKFRVDAHTGEILL